MRAAGGVTFSKDPPVYKSKYLIDFDRDLVIKKIYISPQSLGRYPNTSLGVHR